MNNHLRVPLVGLGPGLLGTNTGVVDDDYKDKAQLPSLMASATEGGGELNSEEEARSRRVRFVEWRALFVAGTRRAVESASTPPFFSARYEVHVCFVRVRYLRYLAERHISSLGKVP